MIKNSAIYVSYESDAIKLTAIHEPYYFSSKTKKEDSINFINRLYF